MTGDEDTTIVQETIATVAVSAVMIQLTHDGGPSIIYCGYYMSRWCGTIYTVVVVAVVAVVVVVVVVINAGRRAAVAVAAALAAAAADSVVPATVGTRVRVYVCVRARHERI